MTLNLLPIIPIPNPQPHRTIRNIPLPTLLPPSISLHITIRRPIARQILPHIHLPVLRRAQIPPQNLQHIFPDEIQEDQVHGLGRAAVEGERAVCREVFRDRELGDRGVDCVVAC